METNPVLFYPSISNTVFPFPFSHSAAHSLSLQKASGLSSLPSVYPICDAVWATGFIIIGGRSAVTNEAKRSSKPPSPLKWEKVISGLTKSTRSGPADDRFPVAAFDMLCVLTPINVCHAPRVSSSVEIWGRKEAVDFLPITQQMHTPRELSEQWRAFSFLVSFFPLLALKQAKSHRLVKTLIYCTITVIE